MNSEGVSINSDIAPKTYSQSALSMLTCCMQKVTAEIIDGVGKTPTWYDSMIGLVMGLGETIYKIENDKVVDNIDETEDLVQLTLE